jgi:hypothetical protein
VQRTAIFVSVLMRFILKKRNKICYCPSLIAHQPCIFGRSPSGRAIRYNGLPLWANHFHCYP